MAAGKPQIRGMSKVLKNLNREIKGIAMRSEAGMKAAALLIKGRSQRNTPVDTGNLKASAYIKVGRNIIQGPWAEIGYTASYAPFVHETHRDPKKFKFLERAFRNSQRDIILLIANKAKVRKT
jgi:hypothetical protein